MVDTAKLITHHCKQVLVPPDSFRFVGVTHVQLETQGDLVVLYPAASTRLPINLAIAALKTFEKFPSRVQASQADRRDFF